MIDKIRALSNDSKYTTWYCNIVTTAKSRNKVDKGENHHIVPVSVWLDGKKMKENIVRLTYREHYICHKLLLKILISEDHRKKMSHALWRLMHKRLSDGVVINSKEYDKARTMHSDAMRKAWNDGKFYETVVKKQWFYNSPEQKEANRQKALKEMQNPETRKKFVQAGLQACKVVRDADTKAWVANSMGSEVGRAKSKQSCQTEEFRERCKIRELSKSVEDRQKLAKQGQQALMEKCGGEEAYRKMLSDRIKGRKAYINPVTGQVKVAYECPNGFVPKVRIADDI